MINLFQNSTIHGVGHVTSATSKIWKMFWFTLLLAGVIGILVNVVFVVLKFLKNPVVLSYDMEYKSFVWPEFTFCNPTAPFYLQDNSTEYGHWNESIFKSKEVARLLANNSDIFRMIHGMEETDFELEERTLAMSSADPNKLMKMSHLYDFISISITRAEKGLDFVTERKDYQSVYLDTDPIQMFSTRYVQIRNNIPCYTFYMSKKKFPKLKYVESLNFYIRLNFKSYERFNSSYASKTIYFYISNKNEIHQDKEIVLSPGFKTTLILTESHHKSLGYKRRCRKKKYKVELYDAFLNSTKLYEGCYKDCKQIVSQELFVQKCNCYSSFLPIFKNASGFPRLCLNATLFSKEEVLKNAKCMSREFKKYEENEQLTKLLLKKCAIYKPNKCHTYSYKIDQRDNIFLEVWSKKINKRREIKLKKYSRYVGTDYTDFLKDSLISLTVIRNSKDSELYEEHSEYPFSELLSDVGGLMGLWLGMSVVGLFELAEMFYRYLCSFCRRDKPRNETPKL